MNIAYFDCFCGAAGDMILAALVHAGLDPDVLHDVVRRLALPEVGLRIEDVKRGGIAARHVVVDVGPASRKNHRHLPEIRRIIDAAGLPAAVTANAHRVFQRLAEAEAAVHGSPIEKVHFHEVGAADAIVDIVGACAGLHALGVERVVCSPIPTGHGVVTCEHGVLPVPPPATALLLRGVPLAACDIEAEICTPTGAAILTTLCSAFGPPPAMRIAAVGYGAGTREFRARANVIRVILGDQSGEAGVDAALVHDHVVVLETQVDDAAGQVVAFTAERLFADGALDVYSTPIIMKKGRPGVLLTVLSAPADADRLERRLLRETPTLGVRRSEHPRATLRRETEPVSTPFGDVRMKIAWISEHERKAWPEYDDCAAAALASGAPLADVQRAALEAWTRTHDRRDDAD